MPSIWRELIELAPEESRKEINLSQRDGDLIPKMKQRYQFAQEIDDQGSMVFSISKPLVT